MGVKSEEKDIAYTELYRMWYDFLLAFADTRMPYRTDGKDNRPIYGYWDKGLLVKQDDAGEWYYPEFDIYVQAETALPKDKRFILDIANKAGDRIDNVEYWMLMESIGVPNASAILEMEQQKLQQPPPPPGGMPPGAPMPPEMVGPMPPMPGMQNALPGGPPGPMPGGMPPELLQIIQQQQLPPELQQQLMSLPPDQREAFLMQILQGQPQPGGLPPEIEQVLAQLPPELQDQFMQLLQTNPEAAMAMLQEVMGGQM